MRHQSDERTSPIMKSFEPVSRQTTGTPGQSDAGVASGLFARAPRKRLNAIAAALVY